MAKSPQKMFIPILLFIFFSALFFGSVQSNGGDVQLVYGYVDSTTRNDLKAVIARGYEIVGKKIK